MFHPRFRHLGLFALALIVFPVSLLIAADPTTSVPTLNSQELIDQTYRDGLKHEINRDWAKAAELYESAMSKWPQKPEFRQRLILCEMHMRLQKRYQDTSFRNILLRMDLQDCARLYSEILDRIDVSYVDPIDLTILSRRGIDNLEVALRDPDFQRFNTTNASPGQIQSLRQWLRESRAKVLVSDRKQAREIVNSIAEKAWNLTGLAKQAVYLEFVFGACDALDEFSACLTPDKLEDLYAVIDGNFVGLGVELKDAPNGLLLTGVIRGGPAWDAGLKAGDVITVVDGKPLQGLGLDQSASLLQGLEGTSVTLTLARQGNVQEQLRLIRRPVEVESVVDAKILEPASGIAYLKMNSFQKTTFRELDSAVNRLLSSGMRLLILDLRGNPGGLLNCSVEIADRFLDRGVIVTTNGRSDGQSQKYKATAGDDWTFPVIVLIDRDSASASEILAGALQENNRADVIGERSFGKGSVQSIFPIKTAPAGLKLTTARFYSPLDRPYTQGVTPNIITRQVARPANSGTIPGQPQEDFVLRSALEHGRTQLSQGINMRTIGSSGSISGPSGIR